MQDIWFLFMLYATHVLGYLMPVFILSSKESLSIVLTQAHHTAPNLFVYGPISAFPLLLLRAPVELWNGSFILSVFNIFNSLFWGDIFFYLVHRLFHTRRFYKFHAEHHQWSIVHPYAAFDATIVEHCLGNVQPFILSGIVCGLQQIEFIYLIALVTFGSVLAHWTKKGPHALHHRNTSVNFGAGLFVLDRLFGTFACDE